MAQPASNNDDDLDFDEPLTVKDWVEIVSTDLDHAVDALTEAEIEELCRAIRKKVGHIIADRRRSTETTPEPERDPRDRWWDR